MRKIRFRHVILGIACIIVLYGLDKCIQKASIICRKSDFFKIKQIKILGNTRLNNDQIIRLAGLENGMNILDIKKGEILDRLHFPWIEQCTIKRKFPHRLEITIREREAVAVCHRGESESYTIDKNGYLIEPFNLNQKNNLPIFKLSDKIGFRVGETFKQAKSALKILSQIKDLYPKNLSEPINIELIGDESAVIKADTYLKKIYISLIDMERKMGFLRQLLPDIRKRQKSLDYVDLRFNDFVIIGK